MGISIRTIQKILICLICLWLVLLLYVPGYDYWDDPAGPELEMQFNIWKHKHKNARHYPQRNTHVGGNNFHSRRALNGPKNRPRASGFAPAANVSFSTLDDDAHFQRITGRQKNGNDPNKVTTNIDNSTLQRFKSGDISTAFYPSSRKKKRGAFETARQYTKRSGGEFVRSFLNPFLQLPKPTQLLLPKPIIVMGYPKAGTSSIFTFFHSQGLISQHWYCCKRK
jgi:hypothetical protein